MQRDDLTCYARLFVGRRNDYAYQREDGRYRRAFQALTLDTLAAHIAGQQTLATYVIDETGRCRFAVYDSDQDVGLDVLAGVQRDLARDGVGSYVERSRRGGHLWVLLEQLVRASMVRAWLLPYCPPGVEFYPKQDEGAGVGSLIRLPLGVHRLSGKRYPFVKMTQDGAIMPVATSWPGVFAWLHTVERVAVPDDVVPRSEQQGDQRGHRQYTIVSKSQANRPTNGYGSIRDWTEAQDALSTR